MNPANDPRRAACAARKVALGLCLTACASLSAAQPAVTAAGPLMDLSRSVQAPDAGNIELRFRLRDVAQVGDFDGSLARTEGRWAEGTGKARSYSSAVHGVDGSKLALTAAALKGELAITLQPDRRAPKDAKARRLVCQVDARVAAVEGVPKPTEPTPIQFWLIKAESQGTVWSLAGTYKGELDGRAVTGRIDGHFRLPEREGFWNMGRWDGGLKLDFDMGGERVNWNYARLALYAFARPADLSKHSGLRVAIDTDAPRDDVSVSVWLREADGSWYYLKSGVPLADRRNEAVLPFEEFAEAEWVAPTNHMDEDYVLDLRGISHVGVGIVDPHGRGKVSFTVRRMELVDFAAGAEPPAKARVTGRTLSVNGYAFVPPGLFGGYAPDLLQKYRPGCQRYLYAPSYPRIPEQLRVKFHGGSFRDWKALLGKLRGAEAEALPKRLWSLLDERSRGRLARLDLERADADRVPRELTDGLNALLRRRDLYAPQAWSSVKLPEELRARAGTFARADMTDTEAMEINRALLAAAFGGEVLPAPRLGPTEAFYIECYGERKEAAPLLYRRDWKEALASFGRTFAANAKKNRFGAYFEFWNEPYLNWAERSRVNLNARFFRRVEGDQVQVAYDGGPIIPHFRWRGGRVVDTTAFSYWSGRGNGWIYDTMLEVMAKAIKQTNPDVLVIAGWGFRWHEDHWAPWDILYRPTIDRGIEYIDGIHEHHYQGDTTAMNGSFEVLASYGMTRHGKWLPCYNTETNDLVDAPARGPVNTPEKAAAAREYRRMTYNLRDIVYCAIQSPDKSLARTMIHHSSTPVGTDVCFTILKELRGRLVRTHTDDENLWCVASIDGTDDRAMPPDGRKQLVAIVFNDHRRPRRAELTIDAPPGTRFGTGEIQQPLLDKADWKLSLRTAAAPGDARSRTYALELPERSAWKIALPLSGDVPAAAQVVRRQFFADKILQAVLRSRPLRTTVKLDKAALSAAARAALRIVIEDVAPGEAAVRVAGRTIELPPAWTADNGNRIVELPIAPADLAETMELEFRVNEGNFAGYRVDMAGIVVEQDG